MQINTTLIQKDRIANWVNMPKCNVVRIQRCSKTVITDLNRKLRLAMRIIKLKYEETEQSKTNMQQYNKTHSYE